MLLDQQQEVALNNLAQRFLDEKLRLKEQQATVDALKEELRRTVGVDKGKVDTEKFSLEVVEIEQNRLMKKQDFIIKNSPVRKDEDGNTLMDSSGEPLRDLSVGTKFYDDHLVTSVSQRFYVKRKTV